MNDSSSLSTRQPWWLRHAAALVAIGGSAIVIGFSLFVWQRLAHAFDDSTARAYERLERHAYVSSATLGTVLEQADLAALGRGKDLRIDSPGESYRSIDATEAAKLLSVEGLSPELPSSPRIYLTKSKHQDSAAGLLFLKPLPSKPGHYLLVEYAGTWLQERIRRTLGPHRAGVEFIGLDGHSVAWLSAQALSAQRQTVLGDGLILDEEDAREADLSASTSRILSGVPAPLPNGWGFLRATGVEAELLGQYYERRRASTWLLPVVAGLVCSLVVIAGAALRRVQRNESELRRQAMTDALTLLPNRARFTALLEDEVERAKQTGSTLGLLFIDLDNFKYVNDSLGHDGGDQLLRTVGERLRAGVRESDTVCRLGGDEFVIVLSMLPTGEAASLTATRVLRSLTKPVEVKGTTLVPQASIGVAVFGEDAHNSDELTRAADMAVYEAKAMGKSCYVRFTPQLARATAQFAQVTRELQLAIERKELFVEYQPKYYLSSHEVAGFEALVRWQHPEQGRMMPGAFIPIAETAGLIGQVGNYVMEQVVAQVRAWYDAGLGWQVVAINVSAVQLRDLAAVHLLECLLEAYKVPGSCIQVELTESALVNDVDNAIAAIAAFKTLGATLAVDDFGTGYSSLHALQRFKVDFLKVDRSFVQGASTEAGSLEICRAIVNLGHSLGMAIIAEGIETPTQRACMQRLGCEQGQGYLLDRPLSAEWATLKLARHAQAHPAPQFQADLDLWYDDAMAA